MVWVINRLLTIGIVSVTFLSAYQKYYNNEKHVVATEYY